jgi:hypothetical protein
VFEGLLNSIESGFTNLLPSNFCIPCFLKGLLEGAAIGFATLALIASAPGWLAVALAVGLAALGAYGIYHLVNDWSGMSDQAKSEALGGIVGGLIAGRFGPRIPPTRMPVPVGVRLLQTPDGVAFPVIATAPVTTTAPAVLGPAAAAPMAMAGAAMMSGGGGGGDDQNDGDTKATSRDVLEPGSKQWKDAAKDIGTPGKSKNYRVRTKQDAEQLLKDSGRDLPEKPTYTDEKYKAGYEHHPSEKNTQNAPQNDLPHIKWKDWSGGKRNGANGHIYYGDAED